MTKAPDDDSWLERIRCPRYFDFEAALTVPCPSGGETNPPLRDAVYESDDETRNFFHTLETDSSLHHTPHPQENSPPRLELRNVRPIYRHRPTTSFQEYLQNFSESPASPACDAARENLSPTQDTSSCDQSKPAVTPRRNGHGKLSRLSPRHATVSGGEEKKANSGHKSLPTSQSGKTNPSTPSRRQQQASEGVTRKSVPNETALLRRRRPPERVTPPIGSGSSKTTSGGFGRNKSRKAIARSDDVERLHEPSSETGKRVPQVTFSPKKTERLPRGEKENDNKRANLLDVDPEILRMMEEHNRRIQQKKALSEGNEGAQGVPQSKTNAISNRAYDQSGARHGRGITVRNRKSATDLEALPSCDKMEKNGAQEPAKTFLKKGQPSQPQDQRRSGQEANHRDLESSKQNQARTNPLQTTSSLPNSTNDRAIKSKSENSKDDHASLDELLRSENERVLQERKKRLPERRRALQMDKNMALSSREGHRTDRTEQDLPRTQAKVEFASANEKSRTGTAALLDKNSKEEARNRNSGKENRERDKLFGTKARKRGLKGLRERSKTGPSASVSSGLSKGPSNAQITRPTASTTRRQPYTDRIKAMERKKRLEKRLEEDLQELLSQHNSRVQGNRKTCSADDR